MNNLSYVADVTELNRYNRKALNQSFDADAIDGDGDGKVQDNTPFERPAVIGAIDAAIEKTKKALEAGKAIANNKKQNHRNRHKGMSNAEIVETAVPDNLEGLMAQFAEQAVAYLTANPFRNKRGTVDREAVIAYIQEQIKELTGKDMGNDIPFDFSPSKIRALRETLAKNLDESPQFRQLVDEFGMPPMFVFSKDVAAGFQGIYSSDFGIGFSQDGVKQNSIVKKISNVTFGKILARLTPQHQSGGHKNSRRWVVQEGLRHTMLHEFGHHVGRTLGDIHKDSGDSRLKNLARYINSHEWTNNGLKTFGKEGDLFSGLFGKPEWDTAFFDRGELPDDMPFVRTVYGETSPVEQFAEAMSAILSPEQDDDDLVSGGLKGIISDLLELDGTRGLVEQLQERQSYTPQERVAIQGFASRGNDVLTPAGNKDKWDPLFKDMSPEEIVDETIPASFEELLFALVNENKKDKLNETIITPEYLLEYMARMFGTDDIDKLETYFDFSQVDALRRGQQDILENQPAFFRHHQMFGAPQSVMLTEEGLKAIETTGLTDFNGAYMGFGELSSGIIVYPPDYLSEIRNNQRDGLLDGAKPSRTQRLLQNFLRWQTKSPKGVDYTHVDIDGDGTVRHEYGHFLHSKIMRQLWNSGLGEGDAYGVLQAFMQDDWNAFFEYIDKPDWKEQYENRRKKLRTPDYPEANSMYGWTSPAEMFAEAYSAYSSPYEDEQALLSPGMREAMDIVFGNDVAQDSVEQLNVGFASRGGTPEVEQTVTPYLEGRTTKTGWGPFTKDKVVRRSEMFANTSTEQKIAYSVPTTREEYVMMAFDQAIEQAGINEMMVKYGVDPNKLRKLIDLSDPENPKAKKEWLVPLVTTIKQQIDRYPPDLSPEAVENAKTILRNTLDVSPALRHLAEKHGLPPFVIGSTRSRNRALLETAMQEDIMLDFTGRTKKRIDEILDDPVQFDKMLGDFQARKDLPIGAQYHHVTGEIIFHTNNSAYEGFLAGNRMDFGHIPKAGDHLLLGWSPEAVYLHEYAHYLDFTIRTKLEKGYLDPESRVAKAHKLLHSEDTRVALKTRRENPLWETDKYPMIETNYGTTNTIELVAEAMSGILAGNPQALDVMNEPLKEAIYDLLDVPEFDAPGGKKQRRMPWIENFTPEPLAPRGFASRGGTDTTIPAQTVSGTKQRRGYKKLKPRYFKTEDGEELELYHVDSTSNTFAVRRNGRGVARVSVIEDNNGLPKLTVMNIDPGYDAAQIESELTNYVKEYFPNARRPEGKTKTVRKVEVPGFASRGDNEVPLENVNVTTPAGISALKEQLQRSKDDNKTATFMYNGELRRVDVRNIYEKDGISYVDGFDQVRGEGRTFRLDRVGQAKVVGTGRDTKIVAPPREPREPVAPYTGEAARLFEGATTYRQVYERLTKGELIFFDFETTGIEQDENGIMTSGGKPVQMGIIRVVDGKVVERKNMYMNPGQALGGWSKDNLKRFDENGVEVPLTDEWLQQQPTIAEAMAEALDFIGENKVMGGQYQIFDQRVMEEALAGTGLEGRWKPAGFIDSKGIIDHLYEKGDSDAPKSNRLGALTDHYGVELTNWHSADADAEASWGVIEAAIRRAAEREETNGSAPVKRTLLNTTKTSGEHDISHSAWQSQHNEWKSTMVDIARVQAESDKQPGFASRGTVEKPLDGRDIAARASAKPKVTDANRTQAALDALVDIRSRLTGKLRDEWDELAAEVDQAWNKHKKNKALRELVKFGIKTSKMAGQIAIANKLGLSQPGRINTDQVTLLEAFVDSGLEDALRIGGIEMMGFLLKDMVANQVIDRERAKEIYNNVKTALAERTEAITQMGREMIGRMASSWEAVASRMKKRPKGFIPLDEYDADFGGITLSDTGRLVDVATKSLDSGPQWAEIAVRDFARHAPEQFTKSMNYTKPALRERIKNQVMAGSDGGKPGQWSARKAQLVAQKYRAAGGGYRGKPSKTQRSLKKWTKERWRTSDGGPAERPGGTRRYLPDAAWEKLTPGQRKATNRKKIEGSRSGRQFVPNTRNAAKAGRQARKG